MKKQKIKTIETIATRISRYLCFPGNHLRVSCLAVTANTLKKRNIM